jgi:hypothetical protein
MGFEHGSTLGGGIHRGNRRTRMPNLLQVGLEAVWHNLCLIIRAFRGGSGTITTGDVLSARKEMRAVVFNSMKRG